MDQPGSDESARIHLVAPELLFIAVGAYSLVQGSGVLSLMSGSYFQEANVDSRLLRHIE